MCLELFTICEVLSTTIVVYKSASLRHQSLRDNVYYYTAEVASPLVLSYPYRFGYLQCFIKQLSTHFIDDLLLNSFVLPFEPALFLSINSYLLHLVVVYFGGYELCLKNLQVRAFVFELAEHRLVKHIRLFECFKCCFTQKE